MTRALILQTEVEAQQGLVRGIICKAGAQEAICNSDVGSSEMVCDKVDMAIASGAENVTVFGDEL